MQLLGTPTEYFAYLPVRIPPNVRCVFFSHWPGRWSYGYHQRPYIPSRLQQYLVIPFKNA